LDVPTSAKVLAQLLAQREWYLQFSSKRKAGASAGSWHPNNG
jgi:hypothetical protein